MIVALYFVESLAVGVFGVAMIAAVIDVLELGQAGVGLASAVMAAGGLVGAFVGLALGGRRLAVALGAGVLVWGSAVALVGAWPTPAFALMLLAVAGLGDTRGGRVRSRRSSSGRSRKTSCPEPSARSR